MFIRKSSDLPPNDFAHSRVWALTAIELRAITIVKKMFRMFSLFMLILVER